MRSFFRRLIYLSIILVTLCLTFVIFLKNLNDKIDHAIKTGWFSPSIEYYSSKVKLKAENIFSLKEISQELIHRNYIPQNQLSLLKQGEFITLSYKQCKDLLNSKNEIDPCLVWVDRHSPYQKNVISLAKDNSAQFYQGSPPVFTPSLFLDPILFAQHEGGILKLRKKVKLNEVPFLCLQSITLAEDQDFLLHKGASPTAILRAFIRNVKNFGLKEGGSTITQQLVKNRFLSFKKTFGRKWVELIMS